MAEWVRRETGSYGFDMWSRAARAVTADYAQHGSPRAQPRAAGFLTGPQEFPAANPGFSAKRMDGVTHFPAL